MNPLISKFRHILRLTKEEEIVQAYQQLEAIFSLSQKFIDASDENQVIEPVLKVIVEMTSALSAAFIPIDEHGQAFVTLTYGELPPTTRDSWNQLLNSTQIRERCHLCEQKGEFVAHSKCPLVAGPFAGAGGVLCLLVRRGERDYGVFALFVQDIKVMDERSLSFARTLVDEMALGLESLSIRRRELAALKQMELLRRQTNLHSLLEGMLQNANQSLEADFAALIVPRLSSTFPAVEIYTGEVSDRLRQQIQRLMPDIVEGGEVLSTDGNGGFPSGNDRQLSALACPLELQDEGNRGVMMVGKYSSNAYHRRHLASLQMITSQIGLVVQNARLMAELEYNTMLQERSRLAREIHDGLAQTLGFLKLQLAQMRSQLDQIDKEQIEQNLERCYQAVSEAYLDARQAIDGLRVTSLDCSVNEWLRQALLEFEDLSGITVELESDGEEFIVPPEVNVQLIRIVQEALTNVRKHSGADLVNVSCRRKNGEMWLKIFDNGSGFDVDSILSTNQHGLRGMRERAELIGMKLEMLSARGQGTTIRMSMPVELTTEVLL